MVENKDNNQESIQIIDSKIIDPLVSDKNFTFLISFPRTGSHWLRMLMELYFEKPSLVRLFYYKEAEEFTCIHKHDLELNIIRENVIYLYRNPVDTVYSQLIYHKENIRDEKRVEYWAKLYGQHLSKWLVNDNFTKKKTIITYEGMKKNIYEEFNKVCHHFDIIFDQKKLDDAINIVSKKEVSRKTVHDKQVINLSVNYDLARQEFKTESSEVIKKFIINQNSLLRKYI